MRTLGTVLLLNVVLVRLSLAGTFTVTNTADSGAGSLRQAIVDANAQPNVSPDQPDRIEFAIAGVNVHTITVASALPAITESVLIDGYTQPGSSTNTLTIGDDAKLRIEISGSNVADQLVHGLDLRASNCTVQGLVINRFFRGNGIHIGSGLLPVSNNRVTGCFIGSDAAGTTANRNGVGIAIDSAAHDNFIGSPQPSHRNVFFRNLLGVSIDGQGTVNNVIQNNYIGVDASGVATIPSGSFNTDAGIQVTAPANIIGGPASGAGNVISGHASYFGVSMRDRTSLRGNFIGTDATGRLALRNSVGVSVSGRDNIVVANVISGNSGGIEVVGSNNVLQSNLIGVAADGIAALGNEEIGVAVGYNNDSSFGSPSIAANKNLIGGKAAGVRNIIAFNNTGIAVLQGIENSILGNSIHSNTNLGIDLVPPCGSSSPKPGVCPRLGVTQNDAGDGDSGSNEFQNFPILYSVQNTGGNTAVKGFLNSRANAIYRLEFFANNARDNSGFGEGRVYLGSKDVATDASGNADFTATFPSVGDAQFVAATATDAAGNTSEFSPSAPGTLQNVSTRAHVQTGDRVMIGGFIITGTDPKRVIIRGIGPSLQISGVPFAGRLEDPVIDLRDSSNSLLASNDNWRDTQETEIRDTGLAPTNDRESAIVRTVAPGAYTAVLRGKNETSGVAVIEAYDLSGTSASQLANISTRSFVQTGENVMIGGFIVGPQTGGGARVLVRAIGPSLARSSVPEPMQDPMLELRDASGALLSANDDWRTNEAQVQATGVPPMDERESALVADLPPGAYTAVVSGKGGTTGVALVEVYAVR
ncbi:MAG: hypothetical protein ABR526_07450 [Chthoniobacterales bacterium]